MCFISCLAKNTPELIMRIPLTAALEHERFIIKIFEFLSWDSMPRFIAVAARARQLTPVFAKGIKPVWLPKLIGLILFLINRLYTVYCLFNHYF